MFKVLRKEVSGTPAAFYRNKQAVRCSTRKLNPRDRDIIIERNQAAGDADFENGNRAGALDTAFKKQKIQYGKLMYCISYETFSSVIL